jgi:hypothetical protein
MGPAIFIVTLITEYNLNEHHEDLHGQSGAPWGVPLADDA